MAGVWVLFVCGSLCLRVRKGNGIGGLARLREDDPMIKARRDGSCGDEMVVAGYCGGPVMMAEVRR